MWFVLIPLLLIAIAGAVWFFTSRNRQPAALAPEPIRTTSVNDDSPEPPQDPAHASSWNQFVESSGSLVGDPPEPAAPVKTIVELPEALREFSMVPLSDLSEEQVDYLRKALQEIAVPSHTAQKLVSPEFLNNSGNQELTNLITLEPILAASVISKANSAFYGLSVPITSVPHAVNYLGINTVRNIALQFLLEQSFFSKDIHYKNHVQSIFEASSIASELCTRLAPRLGFTELGSASAQIVLGSIGVLAMLEVMPPESAIANWPLGMIGRTQFEQQATGTNAAIVGHILMERWNLPKPVIQNIDAMWSILVTPLEGEATPEGQMLALCYFCTWLAEGIIQKKIQDPDQINIKDPVYAELYHFQSYLAQAPLNRLPGLLQAADTRRILARLILTESGARTN